VLTAGGRVLGVTALGRTIEEARSRAYRTVGHLRWPGMLHRTDIAAAPEQSDPGQSDPGPAGPEQGRSIPRPIQEVAR
jgi:hypothetical protein